MLGSYAYITFAQARQALAERLEDSGNVHWSDPELSLYIREALSTWQALAGYWRDRGTFNLSVGVPFYDLDPLLTNGAGELILAMTTKDSDVVPLIQYHLLEPPGIPWVGTTQFTLAEVTNSLQRIRDNFLVETGCVVTHSTTAAPPPPNGRVQLDEFIIDVRRCGWIPAVPVNNLSHIPLWKSDAFSAQSIEPGWSLAPSDVEAYSILEPPPLQLQLIPPPLASGTLDLLTVNSGTALDPTIGVLLGIPENFIWAIKWGALADLLSQDGEPRDDFRAGYCQQRYTEACEIARKMPTLITAASNEVQTFPQAVADLDGYKPSWACTNGAPEAVGCAGQNLIAVSPPPDNSMVYSFSADVVRNAVLPVADADFLQIGREYLDSILGEAQHIAMFKEGGKEFADTLYLHQAFIRAAANYNDRLRAMTIYLNAAAEQNQLEEKRRPRRETDVMEVTS